MQAVVIGAGEVGSAIVGALTAENVVVVAIDQDQQKLDVLNDAYDIQTVCGSGSDPETFRSAQIQDADLIVAVTDSDEVNIVSCAVSRLCSPLARRVARIRSESLFSSMAALEPLGFRIEFPINPERLAAERLQRIVASPFAIDVVDFGSELSLLGVRVPAQAAIVGKTFSELRAALPHPPLLVAARIRDNQVRIPRGNDDIRSGDLLYVVMDPNDTAALAQMLALPSRHTDRVFIAGGTGIGEILARTLETTTKMSVKLIEADAEQADKLAEGFDRTLVLHGSPTNENLLREENIRECDAFVAALPEEEINVLVALNAHRLGARRVIALSNQTAYIPIIFKSGIDAVVSPKALAISTILQHIRTGSVRRVLTFSMGGDMLIIEFEAVPTSEVVGHPLHTLRFPDGALVGAIIRDNRPIIPDGNEVLQPGDRVFIFAQHKAVKRLEKMMAVSFDFFG
ncbi:MAG: Trk system potassium transporter TrkA [Proteobacteria bacterium]|jgi:trk system potassium uptake protein TrkA|nr:Trk system potassium transporter TrkA [Pseudomonadota bacterium]NLN62042.1 Trk system potassium transporter TrkA [Myxococcales bacterium]